MHRCLQIPEILQRVCDEFDDSRSLYRRHLLAMAQTCQHFKRPALSSLWESIDGLSPIIKCAGKEIWKAYKNELLLTRPISPSDVAIMKKYGRLVRRVCWRLETLSSYVWRALQVSLDGSILFPNLRFLDLDAVQDVESLKLFPVHSLTSAKFCYHKVMMLTDIVAQCPNLSSVGMFLNWTSCEDAIPVLSQWRSLSRFASERVTPQVLQTLSQCCGSLRHLQYHGVVKDESKQLLSSTPADTPAFPVLETMEVTFNSSTDAMEFISSFPAGNRLRALEIEMDERSPSRARRWLKLLKSLKRYSNSLEKLSIGDGADYDMWLDEHILPLRISSFFGTLAASFKLLVHINLSNAGGFIMVDKDIKELAEALPLLQTFCLKDGTFTPRTDHATTVASVIFFAQNCPQLSKLSLEFDARTDKLPRRPRNKLARGYKLRELHVSASPLEDAALVADILLTIFPNVEDIECTYLEGFRDYEPEIETYLNPWFEVYRLLRQHKEGRLGRVNTAK